MKKWLCAQLIGVGLFLTIPSVLAAEAPSPSKSTECVALAGTRPKVKEAGPAGTIPKDQHAGADRTKAIGMLDRVHVQVEGLMRLSQCGEVDVEKLILYLDGRPIKKLNGTVIGNSDLVEFQLQRTSESRREWAALLGSIQLDRPVKPVSIAVGAEPQNVPFPPATATYPKINLAVFSTAKLWAGVVIWLVVLFFFGWLARDSRIIRDRRRHGLPEGNQPPYSLAKCQMAIWLFVVTTSFLFIYLITGDFVNTLTGQALILIGIATGTTLGAAVIDVGKEGAEETQLPTLSVEKTKLQEQKKKLNEQLNTLEGAAPLDQAGANVKSGVCHI